MSYLLTRRAELFSSAKPMQWSETRSGRKLQCPDYIMCQPLSSHFHTELSYKPPHFALVGDATMALRTAGSVLVVFLLSVAVNTATTCGQQSQVMVPSTNAVMGQDVTLTCSNTCTLSDNPNPTYIWYKNGQRLDDPTSQQYSCNTLVVWCYSADSYSCAVKDHEDFLAPTVCVHGQSCLNVTYTKRSICALKGSTVDIHCTYRHPSWHNVTEVSWFNKWESGVTTDLSQDTEYAGHVMYHLTTDKDSTLRITDLRESDSAEYKFRFTTTEVKWGYSFPGITLNVTDLQVNETPGTEEGKVTLTCSTTCTLTDNPTYIWYKNGQRLTNPNTQDNYLNLDQIRSEDAGSYSCAVKGYENHRSPITFVGEPKSLNNAVVGIIVVVLILILCLFGFMWFRKKASKSTSDTRDRRDTAENGQRDFNPVYYNVSGMAMAPIEAQRAITDEQDDVTYASIQYRNQEVPLDSTVPLSHPQKQDEDFQYATVKFNSPSAAQ
uniref:Ig-like domain-containing protein n=1 Tax=Hucho hucho TaxID=62062 RepID=A0A4W5M4T7_9TELE